MRETRVKSTVKAALGIAAVCALAVAAPAFAQTGAEYPGGMPGGGGSMPGPSAPGPGSYGGPSSGSPAGGDLTAPAPSGSGETKTTLVPYGEELPPGAGPAVVHHPAVRHSRRSWSVDTSRIEPAQGHLKLVENSCAYLRPSKSSKQIEPVEAGKFVNVMGTSKYYAQVKLKSGEVAYVPLTAIQLESPTDKMFKLTGNASVLNEPNHAGEKLAEVHQGHDVHVVGIALNYMKIRMKDSVEGYIPITALQ